MSDLNQTLKTALKFYRLELHKNICGVAQYFERPEMMVDDINSVRRSDPKWSPEACEQADEWRRLVQEIRNVEKLYADISVKKLSYHEKSDFYCEDDDDKNQRDAVVITT